MSNLEIAIKQAKIQNALQDAANKYGWESPQCFALGGFEAYRAAMEEHDKVFRALSKQERRKYMSEVNN